MKGTVNGNLPIIEKLLIRMCLNTFPLLLVKLFLFIQIKLYGIVIYYPKFTGPIIKPKQLQERTVLSLLTNQASCFTGNLLKTDHYVSGVAEWYF